VGVEEVLVTGFCVSTSVGISIVLEVRVDCKLTYIVKSSPSAHCARSSHSCGCCVFLSC